MWFTALTTNLLMMVALMAMVVFLEEREDDKVQASDMKNSTLYQPTIIRVLSQQVLE